MAIGYHVLRLLREEHILAEVVCRRRYTVDVTHDSRYALLQACPHTLPTAVGAGYPSPPHIHHPAVLLHKTHVQGRA